MASVRERAENALTFRGWKMCGKSPTGIAYQHPTQSVRVYVRDSGVLRIGKDARHAEELTGNPDEKIHALRTRLDLLDAKSEHERALTDSRKQEIANYLQHVDRGISEHFGGKIPTQAELAAYQLANATKPSQIDLAADQRRKDMNEAHKMLRNQRPVFLVSYWDAKQREFVDTEHTTLADAKDRYERFHSKDRPSLWIRLLPAEPH